ncbi:MAG: DUF2652 domain-containing protein [Chitinophagaceae bacterium]
MENKGLLFIPDISGFTQFVNQTEIEHSRVIIQELLELLINANQLGLEVSEIEGDAILFYRFGNSPDLQEIYRQVEKMFRDFHRHLIAYEHRRFCQCDACKTAIDLTLKVITHYGEFTGYNVKNFSKLIGKDIIVAHQLLKNEIEQHEYWLVTSSLSANHPPASFAQWMLWNSSAKQTESGVIPFHYTQLSQLKQELPPDHLPQMQLAEKIKMLSLSREYETDIITLFHATGDFTYRSRWQEGVKEVEEVNHFLPRLGTRYRCISDNGEATVYASSYHYQPHRIEFSETNETKKSVTYYTLEKLADKKTKLSIDYYIDNGFAKQFWFRLKEKNHVEINLRKSMANLVPLVKEIKLPGMDQTGP